MGSGGAFLVGGSMYAIGRFGHVASAADIGLHGLEAIVVGALATDVVKGLVGRARPYAVTDTNPGDVQFTRGFRKGAAYSSFPSGHTTVAFALASSVTAETRRRWPGSTWFVAPLTYGTATLVGVSRLYNNDHWGSDVILAAGIGTFSGLKVVCYNHSHIGNRLDRWLLSTSLVPLGQKSVALTWSLKP
jgi:membrane-associated phospholipid phosphatase